MQTEAYWLFCFQICKLQLASGQTMPKIIFFFNWKQTLLGLRAGRSLCSSHCYLFTVDNPLHPSVSAYLSVKLGVVLMIHLPDTVIVEIKWWIFVWFHAIFVHRCCKTVVYYLSCKELPSATHVAHKDLDWKGHFGLRELSNFCRMQTFFCCRFITFFL